MTPVLPHSPGDFFGASVVELGQRLRNGQLTSVALTHAALESIERLNPVINAFVHVNAEGALAQAVLADAALAAGQDAGPLHGIPVSIKDNIDTFDMPTTYGSAHFAEHQPLEDALCVRRLRDAGAVILGKTLTHEFAYGPTGDRSLQGASKNPWDTTRMTGGSSAGSAAAVASGMVPLALGTDTGGSIRIPTGLCGAVGFKPGFDVVPMQGIFPLSKTLDHVGPIANSVEDAALVFAAISAPSGLNPLGSQPFNAQPFKSEHAPRVAWIDVHAFGAANPVVTQTIYRFAETFFKQPLERLQGFDRVMPGLRKAMAAIQRAEAYEVHNERVADNPQLFDPEVLERLQMSAEVRGWEYIHAMKARDALMAHMAAVFEEVDLLLMPTLPLTAPALEQREVKLGGEAVSVREAVLSLTSAWNLTGLPAINIPAGQVNGLPVGLQVVAAKGRDVQLLDQLRELERQA
jgi:aspartyl-tRNA(Asn)/glutamyl-tRNA(Gln) amidotransferase subunit A